MLAVLSLLQSVGALPALFTPAELPQKDLLGKCLCSGSSHRRSAFVERTWR
ncbi:hypothetical protein LEMLEM_LOCUS13216 [Lemmus lemmus]